MNSLEKFNRLIEFEIAGRKAKITTVRDEVYYCKPLHVAEDEEDWAYSFFTPDYPTHYFILECNFIKRIEEITEDEWQTHLAQNPIR